MSRRISLVISALILSLLPTVVISHAQAAAPKPGTPCKQGQISSQGGVLYKCIKSGSKWVWDKGTKQSGGKNGSASVKVGDPCDREMQNAPIANGTAICVKKNGKLVWQAMGGAAENQNGNGQNNNGNGNAGGSAMGMNADGTWKTLPGYPTDVAPPGMNGEKWFLSNWDAYTAEPTFPKCTTSTPLTTAITDPSGLVSITPQGFVQPGAHNLPVAHMYFNAPVATGETDSKGQAYRTKKVKLVAPADMTLRTIGKAHIQNGSMDYYEYGLGFSVCGNYWIAFAHIDDVNPDILNAGKSAAKDECQNASQSQSGQSTDCYQTYISYRIKAGTVIGYSSGRAHGFDFAFMDTSKPNANILNPSVFKGKITTGKCVMNYMSSDLKAAFMAKLDGNNGCGQVGSDIAGTASGVWLAVGKSQLAAMEDFHLSLVKHWSDKDLEVFGIGTMSDIPNIKSGRYVFTPTSGPANKALEKVKSGEVACYDKLVVDNPGGASAGFSIYIKATTGSTEKIEIGGGTGSCGAGPYSLPSQTQTFERKNITA